MLPYERAVGRFLFRKVLHSHRVLPRRLYRRMLFGFPTFMACVFGSIRMVVGFTLLTPLLLWPPAWPALAAAWQRARREAEFRRRWREDDD
jgi:hypothetical protein